jgi:hypothetical protein
MLNNEEIVAMEKGMKPTMNMPQFVVCWLRLRDCISCNLNHSNNSLHYNVCDKWLPWNRPVSERSASWFLMTWVPLPEHVWMEFHTNVFQRWSGPWSLYYIGWPRGYKSKPATGDWYRFLSWESKENSRGYKSKSSIDNINNFQGVCDS